MGICSFSKSVLGKKLPGGDAIAQFADFRCQVSGNRGAKS
ncbi:hypothetical protein D1AOALGA4SA_235 [Olavius algarvensis Delta 1 endosymbiont]|nr:hypothetical protein D1AOALGA4SA_235 [Olavius algarvensis Delta 1 endosymbiont]